MPWDEGTLAAASASLRQAAKDGDFVPHQWNAGIMSNRGGGYSVYGCGWGQLAWAVAVFQGGVQYARNMMPPGSGQSEVNAVLKAAGITRDEIKLMDPQATWGYFDYEIEDAYDGREEDPKYFIDRSKVLAEYFVLVIEQVPVTVAVPGRFDFPRAVKNVMVTLFGSSAVVSVCETA